MKIRKYIGKSAHEAILKVKMDLGNEAVILSTRKVRKKGFWNWFTKPMIEVLAVIEEYYNKKETSKDSVKESVNESVKEEKSKKDQKKQPNSESNTQLESRVNNIEDMLTKMYEKINNISSKDETKIQTAKGTADVLAVFKKNLIKNEVEEDIAKNVMDIVRKKLKNGTSMNETVTVINRVIAQMLGKPEPIVLNEKNKSRVVIFVGPTGVGKTTTLAKIAANYSLNMKKSVGLITADTYRIAAVEQLKTYAEILGMPVSVVYSAGEIKDAIDQYTDKDIILIDTAGRSCRNKTQFDELKTLITACEADEIFLVLSATTSMSNCKDILKNYNFLKEYKLIFTKLDENPITGIILNARCLTNKKISYITMGQSVPDDFEIANVDKITKSLLGSVS